MALKPPGRWLIQFLNLGVVRRRNFRIMQRALGVRPKLTNSWSAMDDTGANPNLLAKEVLPGVYVCRDAAEVARPAARRFVDWAWQSIAREGKFCVALSGGSTP